MWFVLTRPPEQLRIEAVDLDQARKLAWSILRICGHPVAPLDGRRPEALHVAGLSTPYVVEREA